jgi:general secretion pathway protein A
MYEAYWDLQEKLFENTPDPRFLFQDPHTAQVFARLQYAITGNRGAALLTGESGCGKTLLTRALLQELDADKTEIGLLPTPTQTADGFLREVLYQLGEEDPAGDRTQVIHKIHEILFDHHSRGTQTVLVVEEGQHIEDESLLEEIRLLLNFQLNDAFLVTLLLVGQPQLAERIRSFAPLDQRIAARTVLAPLGPEETSDYIAHRLQVAGRVEPIFSADAIGLVYQYSGGIPRKVNNICDIALLIGSSRKLTDLDADWMTRLIQSEQGNGP